jgi:hypothetical protein
MEQPLTFFTKVRFFLHFFALDLIQSMPARAILFPESPLGLDKQVKKAYNRSDISEASYPHL